MSEKCLISIIVPIYNVEKYLDRCVESIVNQSYKNLEIILVDDGSPDNCPKMCDEWAKKDKRIKVVHKENGGLSDARNVGFDHSKGDYILFVDSDDYIDEKMIEIMLGQLINDNSEMCICHFAKFKDGEEPNRSFSKSPEIVNSTQAMELLLKDSDVSLVVVCDKLMKREIVEKVKFPVGRINEDEATCHRFIDGCNKISIIYNPLYFYYMREGSITKSKFTEKKLDAIFALDDRVEFVSKHYPSLLQDAKVQSLKSIMYLYCNARKLKADKQLIRKIRKEYLYRYKTTNKKTCKTILGRYFPNLYYTLFVIKNKIKGNF